MKGSQIDITTTFVGWLINWLAGYLQGHTDNQWLTCLGFWWSPLLTLDPLQRYKYEWVNGETLHLKFTPNAPANKGVIIEVTAKKFHDGNRGYYLEPTRITFSTGEGEEGDILTCRVERISTVPSSYNIIITGGVDANPKINSLWKYLKSKRV